MVMLMAYILFCSYNDGAGYWGYEVTGAEVGGQTQTNVGCTCHTPTASSFMDVNIQIDSAGVPILQYTPGNTYNIHLKGVNSSSSLFPKYGFQMTTTFDSVSTVTPILAGTFNAPYFLNTNFIPTIPGYLNVGVVEQNHPLVATNGNGSAGTSYEQNISWTAPSAGSGPVTFWASLLAVDGNMGCIGDIWDTAKLTIHENGFTTSIHEALSPKPRVFYDMIHHTIRLMNFEPKQSCVSITIHNISGIESVDLYRNNNVEIPANSEFNIDQKLSSGIYIASVSVNNHLYYCKFYSTATY
jgi:hypothetical protein